MDTLRERLGMRSRVEQQDDSAAYEEFDRLVTKEFERVERETLLDEQLPADHKTRDSADTLNRGVDRLNDAYLFAIQKCVESTGMTPAELDNVNYANRVEGSFDERDEPEVIVTTDRQNWLDDMRDDLEGNFIYGEYLHQLFSDKPVAESYAYYSVYLSIMAALKYVAEYPNAIVELGIDADDKTFVGSTGQQQTYRYCSLRDQAIQFLDWMQVDEVEADDIFDFITQAGFWVPGIGKIADRLLKNYSDAVRTERDRLALQKKRVMDTPLPDDSDTVDSETLKRIRRIYADMRLQRALLAYQNDVTGRSIKEIARDYDINNETLRKEIKNRGLTRSWGGDRKAKRAA